MNEDKTRFMCFKQERAIFTVSDTPLKLINRLTYFGSNISSSENDVNINIGKACYQHMEI